MSITEYSRVLLNSFPVVGAIVTGLLLGIAPTAARATPVDAVWSWIASWDSPSGHTEAGPGVFTSSFNSGPSSGFATVTLGALPSPAVIVHASSTQAGTANVQGHIKYFYHITGIALPGGTVAGQISVTMGNSGSPGPSAFDTWSIATSLTGTNITPTSACALNNPFAGSCVATPSFRSETLNVNFPTDGEIDLAIVTDLAAGTQQGTVVADASISAPVITLPNGYSIAFSSGIGNSFPSDVPPPGGNVPEPASIAILITGLAGLRLARR